MPTPTASPPPPLAARPSAPTNVGPPAKITYTSTNIDLEQFHRSFDEGLAHVRAEFGGSHPLYIDGKAVSTSGPPLVDRSPIDTRTTLGHFATASPSHVDQAVQVARRAQPSWARRPWVERVDTLRRAADLIRTRKYELAARMSIEVGKSRLEAMGDAEEAADLIDYYCRRS